MVGQIAEPVQIIQVAVHGDLVPEHARQDVEAVGLVQLSILNDVIEIAPHGREKKIHQGMAVAERDRDVRFRGHLLIRLHAAIVESHVFPHAVIPRPEE